MSITADMFNSETQKCEFCIPTGTTKSEPSLTTLPYYWPGTAQEIVVVEDEVAPRLTNAITGNIALVRLEEYASANMLKEYSQLAEKIEWANYNPEELLRAVDLALSLDLAALAMRLAQQGRNIFSTHERMQQAGQVLTPPVVRLVETSSAQAQAASQEWLRENAIQYRGQWVAVRAGTLLGTAVSLSDLMPVISRNTEALDILVTKVL